MAWHRLKDGLYRQRRPDGTGDYPTIFARYSVRGRRRFESTQTGNLKEAQLVLAAKQLAGRGGAPVVSGRITVGDLLDDLTRAYALNDRLSRTKRAHLARLRDALGHLRPPDVTADVIEQLQTTWLRTEPIKRATVNRRCNILRRAFRVAQRKGKIAHVPHIGRLDESDSVRGRHMTPAEFVRFKATVAATTPRLVPYLVLDYKVGTRKAQVSRTRRDWVDLTPGRETIIWPAAEVKAREPHGIPVTDPEALAALRTALRDARPWCPYLFHGRFCRPHRPVTKSLRAYGCIGDCKTAFAGACARAGLPYGKDGGFTFHSLRHSAVTNLRNDGVHEDDVMRVTGHKTREVFQRYNHVALEALRARLKGARAADPVPAARRPERRRLAHGRSRPGEKRVIVARKRRDGGDVTS
jgi:integrase